MKSGLFEIFIQTFRSFGFLRLYNCKPVIPEKMYFYRYGYQITNQYILFLSYTVYNTSLLLLFSFVLRNN